MQFKSSEEASQTRPAGRTGNAEVAHRGVATSVRSPDALRELPLRNCRFCGKPFRARSGDQVFCLSLCRRQYWRKQEVRGAQAVELLLRWRRTRGCGDGKGGAVGADALGRRLVGGRQV